MSQIPETGFLRIGQIIGDRKRGIVPLIPISKTAWWDGVNAGKFPKPVKLGPKTTVWKASDIRDYISAAG